MKTVENYFTNIESYHRIVTSHYHDYLEMIKDYDNYSNGKDFSDLDEETQNIIYAVQKSMDTPHITLGRSVELDEISAGELEGLSPNASMQVRSITLFESTREGSRMVYTPLHRERF